MDDLLGEDWQAAPKPASSISSNPLPSSLNYGSFRASSQAPSSGASSPHSISRPSSTVNGFSKPTNDSFSNLFAPKTQKTNRHLSIQERQKQLVEEKRRQQEQESQLWNNFGSGMGTPEVRGPSPTMPQSQQGDEDILAAFTKSAPVDNTTHFPPPPLSKDVSGRNTPALARSASGASLINEADDDPFGLGAAPLSKSGNHMPQSASRIADDDDILGELGKPVNGTQPKNTPPKAQDEVDEIFEQLHASANSDQEPEDRALAELIDMGFSSDTAKIALSENGGDVQNAVGWLLQQAHEESLQKASSGLSQSHRPNTNAPGRSPPGRSHLEPEGAGLPAWMRQESRSGSSNRRDNSKTHANGDKDAAQMAQEFGNKLFKGANSLWKASQKQMAKTLSEFQQERDPSQPKWMQDISADSSRANSQRRQGPYPVQRAEEITDEAAMLNISREPRHPKPTQPVVPAEKSPARGRSPGETNLRAGRLAQPKFVAQQTLPQQDRRPATKLSRQDVEDQAAQAYVSPARRKRPTPTSEPQSEPEVDIFSSPTPGNQAQTSAPSTRNVQTPPQTQSFQVPRSKAPTRNIPPCSPAALSTSAQHRNAGREAFKRGDYATAHESYTAALAPLPPSHPIMIVVLSNRSLTALKTGNAKMAVSDADRALEIIGVSHGAGELIDLGADGTKDMAEFYGKALMRKAEALEHMEKWSEAASVWRLAVEAGVGGAISLRGRDRCAKAASPISAAPPSQHSTAGLKKASSPATGRGKDGQRPLFASTASATAVKKLREANAAAEKADDEKFALSDQVDARLTAWKGGKADNLRALLQSLDSVLWEGAGWQKVGMSDLVMPNKVKIVYMKAIAKVHPDKVCSVSKIKSLYVLLMASFRSRKTPRRNNEWSVLPFSVH